jgi:excisionase family DNA binding protein
MSCLKARNSIAFVSEVSIEYLKRALKIGSMARKEVLKMAFVNMFNDRVELFNLKEENERLAELFSDEKLQEEALWEAYSVKEISKLLSITEEEALKLMNCGIFKTYRVGNEYRASKKSVEENKKVVKAVLTYQDKKTMSVPDVMRILGLGKTATYRLINQCRFKTYLVLGKMRVDVDSFEDWYAGQFHYEKVNGERPGKKYGKTLSPLTVAKVLGIPRSTANDLMNDGIVEFIWVDGKRRIKRESFDKWYASQSKYTKVKEIEEVEGYVD